ncbi:MAG: hypothetical protein ACTSU4_00595 [Promethearchaeota archaeon]
MPLTKKKRKKDSKGKEKLKTPSLDMALKSTKKSESSLQNLLSALTEDEKEKKTGEHVESKSSEEMIKIGKGNETAEKKKIIEEYLMEDVPLPQRVKPGERKRVPLISMEKTKEEETPLDEKTASVIRAEEKEISKDEIESEKVKPPIVAGDPVKPVKLTEPPVKTEKIEEENFYTELAEFIKQLFEDYSLKYELWETQISSILSILRKMRKVTERNALELVNRINQSYERIIEGLEYFKIKRDAVQKMANVDIENMAEEFKKVLGLLELQVKEYQLKKDVDEYIHEIQFYAV